MSKYFLDNLIPRDKKKASTWIRNTCREVWGALQPDPRKIQWNIEAFHDFAMERGFDGDDIMDLIFKKEPRIGFRLSDYVEWNVRNGAVERDQAKDLSRLYTYLEERYPLEKYGKRGTCSSNNSAKSTRSSASRNATTPNPPQVNNPVDSQETTDQAPVKKPCRRNSQSSTNTELSMETEPEQVTPSTDEVSQEKLIAQVTDSSDQVVPPSPPTIKPKPLMVHGISSEALRAFAQQIDSEEKVEFTVQMAGPYVKVQPETPWDKFQISQALERLGIEFFIVPDLEPTMKVVIGKLRADPEDIKDFLTSQGFEVTKVVQMTSRRDSKPLPLYLTCLKKTEKSAEIFKLKSIFRIRVTVEKFRPPKKALQCYRCNGFRHIAINCKFQPKCAICAEKHETKVCPRKSLSKEERLPPKCCNCNESHTASYKGCKEYPERRSYAQVTKKTSNHPGSAHQQEKPQRYSPDQFDTGAFLDVLHKLKEEMQVESLTDLLRTLKETLAVIQRQPDVASKRIAFLEGISKVSPVLPGASVK